MNCVRFTRRQYTAKKVYEMIRTSQCGIGDGWKRVTAYLLTGLACRRIDQPTGGPLICSSVALSAVQVSMDRLINVSAHIPMLKRLEGTALPTLLMISLLMLHHIHVSQIHQIRRPTSVFPYPKQPSLPWQSPSPARDADFVLESTFFQVPSEHIRQEPMITSKTYRWIFSYTFQSALPKGSATIGPGWSLVQQQFGGYNPSESACSASSISSISSS